MARFLISFRTAAATSALLMMTLPSMTARAEPSYRPVRLLPADQPGASARDVYRSIILVEMMGPQGQQQTGPASPGPGGGMSSGGMPGGGMPGAGMSNGGRMMGDRMAMPQGQGMPGPGGSTTGSMLTAPDCCMPNMAGMPGRGMPGMGMMPMMDGGTRPSSSELLDHFNGRLAFLKAEISVTPAQEQAWGQFEQALRTGRQHLLEARQALASAGSQSDVQARLAAYEHHLAMRLDALRSARESFNRLYGMLDDSQKRTANELAGPFLEAI